MAFVARLFAVCIWSHSEANIRACCYTGTLAPSLVPFICANSAKSLHRVREAGTAVHGSGFTTINTYYPPQNPFPAPVSTIACTLSSLLASRTACSSSHGICLSIALNAAGRFKVIVATRSFTAYAIDRKERTPAREAMAKW